MLPSLAGLSLNDEEPTGVPILKKSESEIAEDRRQAALNKKNRDDRLRAGERRAAERRNAWQEEARRILGPNATREEVRSRAKFLRKEEEVKGEYNEYMADVEGAAAKREVVRAAARTASLAEASRREEAARVAAAERAAAAERVAAAERAAAEQREEAARVAAAERAAEALPNPMEVGDDSPPYRGVTALLQPRTYDRIEKLREHLAFKTVRTPVGQSAGLADVLPIGFNRLIRYASLKRGTKEKEGKRPPKSPAEMEKIMWTRRTKAWKAFVDAKGRVLNDDNEKRTWEALTAEASNIPLDKVRWNTKQYFNKKLIDHVNKEKGRQDAAMEHFNDPDGHPAIQKEMYEAMQRKHSLEGSVIFVRTEKVQKVYEAVLAFCQADLKYEVTMARRRTWAALYEFMEKVMLKKWDPNNPAHTREVLWAKAIDEARRLPCFPTHAHTFERLQVLMETQVANNIQWQYPYYNAYDLSRDGGIFGNEFKFVISEGPTMSLIMHGTGAQTKYYVQHVHVSWGWMRRFLREGATDLARTLGSFCASRFLVDEEYQREKDEHDEAKNRGVPEALQTLPDPRTKALYGDLLSLGEQRRMDSDLSDRGKDEASRGAQITLGLKPPNQQSINAEPLTIDRLRPYGSLTPDNYVYYDPFFEELRLTYGPSILDDRRWPGTPYDWRPDITENRNEAFKSMFIKYDAYAQHQEFAQKFINALEKSEEELYDQAYWDRSMVSNVLDPGDPAQSGADPAQSGANPAQSGGCLRDRPKRVAMSFSLTSGFNVAPHDDSGSALEHIVFTYPAHTDLPLGHNPMFVASGVIMMLPGPADRGPPDDELANIHACLCTVPGQEVHHGSMPTWTAGLYQEAFEADKLAELTLPKHFKCGSALITKTVPRLLANHKKGFPRCRGLIDELNHLYFNNLDIEVDKLRQLLYDGNELGPGDDEDTKGKVWSFEARTRWLASYDTEEGRKEAKSKAKRAYDAVYKPTDEEKQAREVREQRQAQQAQGGEVEYESESASDVEQGAEEDGDLDGGSDGNGGEGGGSGDESAQMPPHAQRQSSDQPGSSVAPMDVEGDGGSDGNGGTLPAPTWSEVVHKAEYLSTRKRKQPNFLGNFEIHDDVVEVNGRKVKDPLHWIKDDLTNQDNMAKRAEKMKERKEWLETFRQQRAAAQATYDKNPNDRKAAKRLMLARETVQAAKRHIEVVKERLAEYDALHPQ